MSTPRVRRPPRTAAAVAEAHALRDLITRFTRTQDLRASADWGGLERRLHAILDTPRRYEALETPAPPRDSSALRVVHWNVEHGNWYDQIERALVEHPALANADIVMCNEIDLGMARAGNRDVTGDLAEALGLHAVYAPLFLESTLGRDDDAVTAAGRDNEESLFGLAVLSRWPIGQVRLVPLPSPEEIQFDLERMYGRFVGLVCEILRPGAPFLAISVHLEVHRTREHRAAQMRALLRAIAHETQPVVMAGDFNTHTFDRGLWHSTFTGALPLLTWFDGPLRERLLHPDRGAHSEPLFHALSEAGFAWVPFVDFAPTLRVRFDRLDEVNQMPAPLRALVQRGLGWLERRAQLRLDWICARGFQPSRPDGSGLTVHGLDGAGLASDHAPLVAELALP